MCRQCRCLCKRFILEWNLKTLLCRKCTRRRRSGKSFNDDSTVSNYVWLEHEIRASLTSGRSYYDVDVMLESLRREHRADFLCCTQLILGPELRILVRVVVICDRKLYFTVSNYVWLEHEIRVSLTSGRSYYDVDLMLESLRREHRADFLCCTQLVLGPELRILVRVVVICDWKLHLNLDRDRAHKQELRQSRARPFP